MDTFYLLCAIIGGTVLLLQFAMTVLGLSGDSGDGGDLGGDVGSDVGADIGADGGIDPGGHDFSTDIAGADGHTGSHHAAHDQAPHHGTVWFFKVITFQTLVAALAFFGIAGKAAREAELSGPASLFVALGIGVAAMYGVYYMIRGLHKFNADGTVQIGRAVGQPGTVYIPIPGANAGAGKIQMNLQNRIVEFQAMTAQDRLPSGAKVKVVGVIGPDTVEVERLIEVEAHSHA